VPELPHAGGGRGPAAVGVSVEVAARYVIALDVLVALVFGAVAATIFWRRSDDGLALFVALTLLTFGSFGIVDQTTIGRILAQLPPFWQIPVDLVMFLGAAGFTLFFFTFPSGWFEPRWLRWPVAVWVLSQGLATLFPSTLLNPNQWPLLPNLLYWLLTYGVCLFAQVYRYRYVSNGQQQRQTKWVVYGTMLTIGGAASAYTLTSLAPALGPGWAPLALARSTSYYPFVLLIPLSIGVAILRSRLYDIDIIIRRTLVYAALTGTLGLIYLGSVAVLQQAVVSRVGDASRWVIVASTLLIAALFRPLHALIQRLIDRRFYRRRYDAQATLTAFSASLRASDEVGLESVTGRLLSVVQETIQPAQVSLWLRPSAPAAGAGPAGLDRPALSEGGQPPT
jgi:hypothetical protein